VKTCCVRLLTVVLTSLALSGCASNSVFKNYPSQMYSVKNDVTDNKLNDAYERLSKNIRSADKILYLQERGRIASIQGNFEGSIADWEAAFANIEKNRMKATVSMSKLAGEAAGMMINDNAIPYAGKSYELVFLHTFQIYNYLGKGDLSGALVEARRANNEQTYALEQHHKELAKVKQDIQEAQVDSDTFQDALQKGYKEMAFAAGKVKTSFQNPYTYYLSGVLYEMTDDLDNAYIAYKQALELTPDNTILRANVMRLGKRLRMNSDLAHFSKLFGSIEESPWPRKDQGRLVVIYEDGWIPAKEQIKIPIYFNKRSYTVAMPYYDFGWKNMTALSIKAPKRWLGKTEPLCWVRSLAAKALVEDYPRIFLRQLLRLVTKTELQNKADKEDRTLRGITSLASLLSENADRRSWLTLPDTVQVADFFLPEGTYPLEFQSRKADNKIRNVHIEEGKTTLIRVIRLGSKLYINAFNQPKA